MKKTIEAVAFIGFLVLYFAFCVIAGTRHWPH